MGNIPAVIPDTAIDGIKKILTLTAENLNLLYNQLKAAPIFESRFELLEYLREHQEIKGIESIYDVLVDLYLVSSGYFSIGTTIDEFVENLCNAIKEIKAFPKMAASWDQLKEFFKKILQLHKPFGITTKTIEIKFEYERLLTGVRILTDFRPIFTNDSKEMPPAGIISHNIRISYTNKQKYRDIYLSLKREDIEKLIKVCERALEKDKTLRDMLSEKVRIFGGDED